VASTSLFTGLGGVYFNQSLATQNIELDSAQHQLLMDFLASVYRDLSTLSDFSGIAVSQYVEMINTALLQSMSWVMALVAVLSFAATGVCYRLVRV
jgi:hypothetical protein